MIKTILDQILFQKSLLIIGSDVSNSCIEARNRGASRVLGLEMDPNNEKKLKVIADLQEKAFECRISNIEKEKINEKFDLVALLNILQYLKDPIQFLNHIIDITKEILILEATTSLEHVCKNTEIANHKLQQYNKLPIIFVGTGTTWRQINVENKNYYFSTSALLRIVGSHRKVFSDVKAIASNGKNRTIIVAKKRKIKNFLVVSGPTASGKSTLIENIYNNPNQIGSLEIIKKAKDWPCINPGTLESLSPTTIDGKPYNQAEYEGTVFHYDFLRPYSSESLTYENDQSTDIFNTADSISFFTLCSNNQQLINQFMDSELSHSNHSNAQHKNNIFTQKIFFFTIKLIMMAFPDYLLRRTKGLPYRYKKFFNERPRYQKNMDYYKGLLSHYTEQGWIEQWYLRWYHFTRLYAGKTRDNFIVKINSHGGYDMVNIKDYDEAQYQQLIGELRKDK